LHELPHLLFKWFFNSLRASKTADCFHFLALAIKSRNWRFTVRFKSSLSQPLMRNQLPTKLRIPIKYAMRSMVEFHDVIAGGKRINLGISVLRHNPPPFRPAAAKADEVLWIGAR
jgi:hypothetical protein